MEVPRAKQNDRPLALLLGRTEAGFGLVKLCTRVSGEGGGRVETSGGFRFQFSWPSC